MACFDDLDFNLHMQIFDLCIENKAEYVFNTIKYYDMEYVEEDFLIHDDILNALKDNQNLIQDMGSIVSIIDKYYKWISNEWQPLHKKISIIYNGNYKMIKMLGRFNMTKIEKGNYLNTINGRFKIEKVTEKNVYYIFKGENKRCKIDEKFLELNRNVDYF